MKSYVKNTVKQNKKGATVNKMCFASKKGLHAAK